MTNLQTATCRKLAFAILASLQILACGIANVITPTPQTSFATPEPTANVVCTALRGAVTIRNADGRAVGWLGAGMPVCVVPGVKQGRLQLADGKGTILAACVYGPPINCK